MLARQQPARAGMGHDSGQKPHSNLSRQQPVAVVGESRGISHRVIDAETDGPVKQQVKFDALDQLALGPDAVEHLQQENAP